MRQSARNILPGKVVDIIPGAVSCSIHIDIGGTVVTASITNEAVANLGLKVGANACAVIKASDVMVGVDD